MTTVADKVRGESLSELKRLAGWFDLQYGTTIIVLGGWAVFSYNPYQGSFDIDCVGPREPFYSQLDLYMSSHGYELKRRDRIGLTKFFAKPIAEQGSHIGDINIDACSFEDENPFKENTNTRLPYGLCAKTEYIDRRQINSTYVWVPTKELLFLYKLKALRDRTWIMVNEEPEPAERSYIQGKMEKDKTDLLALLDPEYEPLDSWVLYGIIKDFELGFIIDTIRKLPNEQDAINNYKKTKKDIENWVSRILQETPNV